jgi:hypothetical protein
MMNSHPIAAGFLLLLLLASPFKHAMALQCCFNHHECPGTAWICVKDTMCYAEGYHGICEPDARHKVLFAHGRSSYEEKEKNDKK